MNQAIGRIEILPDPLTLARHVAEWMTDAALAANARNSAHLEVARRLGVTSYLCMPLTARGRALGVLTLIATEGHRRYDAGDLVELK